MASTCDACGAGRCVNCREPLSCDCGSSGHSGPAAAKDTLTALCGICRARPAFQWANAMGGKESRPCDPCYIHSLVTHPAFSHTTYVERCFRESLLFYRRDETSPSGVILLGSVEFTPANKAELAKHNQREIPGPTRGHFARL